MNAFLMSTQTANLVSFSAEYLIALWFFRPLENRTSRCRRLLAYLCLAALCYLYLTPQASMVFPLHSVGNLTIQLGRMVFHAAVLFGYLAAAEELKLVCAAYQAGYFTVLYLTVQNLRVSAMLLTGMAGLQQLGAIYLAILIELALAVLIRTAVILPARQGVGSIRWALVSLAAMLQLYFKWSLAAMQDQPAHQQGIDAVIFAICASLGVLLILSLFEVNQRTQAERSYAQLEQVSLSYEMQNAKRALQTNNDIRRLYHDMKNHLLAIRSMAGEAEELQTYLGELLPRFEGYEGQVFTGSSTIDALLSEKIQRAALDDIRFNVCLDLSGLSFVKSVDLITIFGNAVDNAIEAAQMLPAGVERIIYLKSSRFANLTVLRFSNQFRGKLVAVDGSLLTRKADPEMHGIGMNSIRETAGRYGESMETRADNERGWFDLTLMIPDQDE